MPLLLAPVCEFSFVLTLSLDQSCYLADQDMSAQPPLLPIIPIDSGEARNLDISIALKKIYYQPIGYQRNAKKLHEASIKAGYDFTIDEVKDWLERQLLHLLHKPRPRYIPRASFSSITTPNEMHQADILYTRHIKSGRTIYLFFLHQEIL
ncbi:hypothetical protein GLOIN_2v1878227 [Rhizophagus clarus]|uniref:Uncharacterized protein n=1 Tax=Rhizophagus clarus TaxID=94130 RepID=A0A8H3L9R8_9GLOM|nr:hypothetical protein GLOIN_2v1878227 [Rhizophagus clarus]